jgi:GNAT superfamily N-acetyltransferase
MFEVKDVNRAKQIADFVSLLHEYVSENPEVGFKSSAEDYCDQTFLRLNKPFFSAKVGYLNSKPVGFATMSYSPSQKELWIEDVYVGQEHRRQGYGRKLLWSFEPEAANSPAYCVMFKSSLSQRLLLRLVYGIKIRSKTISYFTRDDYNKLRAQSEAQNE